jgi:hypothetical protein
MAIKKSIRIDKIILKVGNESVEIPFDLAIISNTRGEFIPVDILCNEYMFTGIIEIKTSNYKSYKELENLING